MLSPRFDKTRQLALLVGLTGLGIWGCSNEGEQSPPPFQSLGGHGGSTIVRLGICDEEQSYTQECTVYLEQANGITSCFTGIQFCDSGSWSDCLDPDHDPRVQ